MRLSGALPQTASGKVTKGPLRAEGWWAGDDPVVRRVTGADGTATYLPFGATDLADLRTEFRRHGRQDLVGG